MSLLRLACAFVLTTSEAIFDSEVMLSWLPGGFCRKHLAARTPSPIRLILRLVYLNSIGVFNINTYRKN